MCILELIIPLDGLKKDMHEGFFIEMGAETFHGIMGRDPNHQLDPDIVTYMMQISMINF